jgi:hypothetical protein
MQQDADFITVDFLYMFRASCAHHHEYNTNTNGLTHVSPLVLVLMLYS